MSRETKHRLASAALIIGFFVAWEVICTVFGISSIVLPKPSEILTTLVARMPAIWPHAAQTLYETLVGQTGSPIVELNRAVAVAELEGPEAGLAVLDGLDLDHYRYFHSARAELLCRAGRDAEAGDAYRRALDLAQTDAERRSLQHRLAQLRVT